MLRRRWLVPILSILAVAGCAEVPTTPLEPAAEAEVVDAALRPSRAEGRGRPWVAFYCSVSERRPNGTYKYRMQRLRLTRDLYQMARGRTVPFHYTEYTEEMTIGRVVSCDVPAVFAAGRLVMHFFDVGAVGLVRRGTRGPSPSSGPLTSTETEEPCNPWEPANNEDPECAVEIPGITVGGTGGGTPPPPPPPDDPAEPPPPPPPDEGTGGGSPGGSTGGDESPGDTEYPPVAFDLQCPTPTRGEGADCVVMPSQSGTTFTVGWAFSGGGVVNSAETSGRWGGTWAAGGTMKAAVYYGPDVERLPDATVTVLPRDFTWGGAYSYASGAGPMHPEGNGTPGEVWGWVCEMSAGCPWSAARGGISPHWTGGNGATVSSASGPNQGLHYVGAAVYRMNLGSRVNQNLLPGAPTWTITDPADRGYCSGKVTPDATGAMQVNFFTYNYLCRGTSTFATFVSALNQHEDAHGNLAMAAAADAANDPRRAIESVVAISGSDVTSEIERRVGAVHGRIHQAAVALHSHSLFWWGDVRGWNGALGRFVDMVPLWRTF